MIARRYLCLHWARRCWSDGMHDSRSDSATASRNGRLRCRS